jgi:hypothetical protein
MRRTWEIAFLDKQRTRSAAGNSIEEGLKRPKGKNGMGGGGRAKTKEERLTDPKFLTQKHTHASQLSPQLSRDCKTAGSVEERRQTGRVTKRRERLPRKEAVCTGIRTRIARTAAVVNERQRCGSVLRSGNTRESTGGGGGNFLL